MTMTEEIAEKCFVGIQRSITLMLISAIIKPLLLLDLAFYVNYTFITLSISMRLILSSLPFYSYRDWAGAHGT